jgi:hypothetical protein
MTERARASDVIASHRSRPEHGPIYVIRLRAQPGSDAHGLRALLKIALRRFNLRCIDVHEEGAADQNTPSMDGCHEG